MLPRRQRLARGDFPRVYRRGRRQRSALFTIWRLAVEPRVLTKFGVVVSKRVAAKAVARNLYRRRVWASLRSLAALVPPGQQIVISVNPGIVHCSYTQLHNELKGVLIITHHSSRPYS